MHRSAITTAIETLILLGASLSAAPPATTAPASTPASNPAVDGLLLKTENGAIFVPNYLRPTHARVDLLVHFHGDPATLARNLVAVRLNCAAMAVNYGGLSSAYARPFLDKQLFGRIVDDAMKRLKEEGIVSSEAVWRRICVSSFSAGFGAVREILKEQRYVDMIDGLCMADTIYAGYVGEIEKRQVDPDDMVDFRRFALLAAEGKKTFILSHSMLVPGTYASTIETTDDLIRHVGGKRVTVSERVPGPFEVLSKCEKGSFRVYACAGTDGQAHMQHLRQIGRWLGELPFARANAGPTTAPARR